MRGVSFLMRVFFVFKALFLVFIWAKIRQRFEGINAAAFFSVPAAL